jgi:MtN3 and saliva related transmembrane protein
MNYLTPIIGFIAGILTTVAFVPQIIRVWRTHSAEDISLGMYTLFTLGVVLWLVYGILIYSWPIIFANCVTLLLAGAVLVMKVKFGCRKK